MFIRNRQGDIVRASWDEDMIAYQIGESAQIHSGGELMATPHCVRGSGLPNVSRSTLAVFMQPNHDVMMLPPKGIELSKCEVDVLKEEMDFTKFTEKRLSEYY